jgi:hypothetical protein
VIALVVTDRSPKDALFEIRNDRVVQELRKEIRSQIKMKGRQFQFHSQQGNIDLNDQFIALTRAANRSMRMTSGHEAVKVCHWWHCYSDE